MIGREWGTGRDAKGEVWGGLESNTGCLLSRDMIRPNKDSNFNFGGLKYKHRACICPGLVFSRMSEAVSQAGEAFPQPSEAFPQASEFWLTRLPGLQPLERVDGLEGHHFGDGG